MIKRYKKQYFILVSLCLFLLSPILVLNAQTDPDMPGTIQSPPGIVTPAHGEVTPAAPGDVEPTATVQSNSQVQDPNTFGATNWNSTVDLNTFRTSPSGDSSQNNTNSNIQTNQTGSNLNTPTVSAANQTGTTNVSGGTSKSSRYNNAVTLNNPLGAQNQSLMDLIATLLILVARIGAVICVFFIIYSGFLFIKAQGNEGELTKAKSIFMWSIIGTAVLLGASVIAQVITGTVYSVLGIR